MNFIIKSLLSVCIVLLSGTLIISAQTVTVWEKTTQLYQHNFPVNSPKLSQIRSIPYSSSNKDFAGWEGGQERYDVFFSTTNGKRVARNKRCVTVRGQSTKGGFNITRVDIKTGGVIRYYSRVTNYKLGVGGDASSRFKVVDGNKDNSWSKFGMALNRNYMSITVCNPKRLLPNIKPLPATPANLRVPKGCPRNAKRYRIRRDATTGTKPTKFMTKYLNSVKKQIAGQSVRGYGEGGQNRFFGDSFPLKGCKVCAGTLTAVVDNQGGLSHNDALYVYFSNSSFQQVNNGTQGERLLGVGSYGTNSIQPGRTYLWKTSSDVSPKTLKLNLNNDGNISASASPQKGISRINQYIFNNSNPHLEVWAQDDTTVKSIVLDVWTY